MKTFAAIVLASAYAATASAQFYVDTQICKMVAENGPVMQWRKTQQVRGT